MIRIDIFKSGASIDGSEQIKDPHFIKFAKWLVETAEGIHSTANTLCCQSYWIESKLSTEKIRTYTMAFELDPEKCSELVRALLAREPTQGQSEPQESSGGK